MPSYKLCPRCMLNYILESEEYCDVCKDELRGVRFEEEEEDDFYTKTCPRCGALIPDDMEYCENCKQDLEDKIGDEDDGWESDEDNEENEDLVGADDENMDPVDIPEGEGFDDEGFDEEEEEEEETYDDEEEDFGFDTNVDEDDYDEDDPDEDDED